MCVGQLKPGRAGGKEDPVRRKQKENVSNVARCPTLLPPTLPWPEPNYLGLDRLNTHGPGNWQSAGQLWEPLLCVHWFEVCLDVGNYTVDG